MLPSPETTLDPLPATLTEQIRRIPLANIVLGSALLLGSWALFSLQSCTADEPAPVQRVSAQQDGDSDRQSRMLSQLDAPLLFVKRHSYSGIHIYDTYYKWPPGGGGIYILENPTAPRAQWRIRPIVDGTTAGSPGEGVYTDPELSWDGTRLLFCFKGSPDGNTCIYEINLDGSGLRKISDPAPNCVDYRGRLAGQHDIMPAYLPDDRIVFLSTRLSGLVPCNNTGVAILHVMNADGSDIHSISVNNVNEFDPCPLLDGRLLFGRWEYVDKNALTIQSLWSMNPDGTQETAVFANNMVFPEAILDARPVPNSRLIVGTFAKHNSTPRGSIAMIDPQMGKNDVGAIFNFEHPDQPTFDKGNSCEPWPLSSDLVLFSGRPAGHERNVIEMMDRRGTRVQVLEDMQYCLHSPMLVKPRVRPPAIAAVVDRQASSGRFFVQDIYQGLPGVRRGEVKWLRVLEETSRTSEGTDGPNPYNQTFLLSSALAFSVKNFLGIVPVAEDGSAYFEVPSGRAVYFQALDEDGRLIQSMRTFVQASPGTTRSCVGCHEHKYTATSDNDRIPRVLADAPDQLEPESWGSGFLDFASDVQPVLDRHCVRCHGGVDDIAAGIDLSGGWTEHFNIAYENLTNRSQTQLIAYWIAAIDCMNGTALWSARIFPPRSHGSGVAPLAELLVDGHDERLGNLTRAERDLLMAWIDTNGLYYGTWNRTSSGCRLVGWDSMKQQLVSAMQRAGCMQCHADGHGDDGQPIYFENDWVNLEHPAWSRLLRAPLASDHNTDTGDDASGLAWCRDRKVTADRQRLHLLWKGYAHAVQPPAAFEKHEPVRPERDGKPHVSFRSTDNPHYQAMLSIIQTAKSTALRQPRVDMPGADLLAGQCRCLVLPERPSAPLHLDAEVTSEGAVTLQWNQSAEWIGHEFELHRSTQEGFSPSDTTRIARTRLFAFVDWDAPIGVNYYALRSARATEPPTTDPFKTCYVCVQVPAPRPPAAPQQLAPVSSSGTVRLRWRGSVSRGTTYHVERAGPDASTFTRVTKHALTRPAFVDWDAEPGKPYRYRVIAISRRGTQSEAAGPVQATPTAVAEPVFSLPLDTDLAANRNQPDAVVGTAVGEAAVDQNRLKLGNNEHVSFPYDSSFGLQQPLTVTCRVKFDASGTMPVIISCGQWQSAGWFLQRLGNHFRWYAGGLNCDGGAPVLNQWTTLTATLSGDRARLYQDGKLVADVSGDVERTDWTGPLMIGQYSGRPGPEYQFNGSVRNVQIFHRVLDEIEIRALAMAEDAE